MVVRGIILRIASLCLRAEALLLLGLLSFSTAHAQPKLDIGSWDPAFFPAIAPEISAAAFDRHGRLVVAGYQIAPIERVPSQALAVREPGGWRAIVSDGQWAGTLARDESGNLYASVGEVDGDRYFGRWDGDRWTRVADGFSYVHERLAVGPDGTLYGSAWTSSRYGSEGNGVVRWNGSSWIGLPGSPDFVTDLDTDSDGNLYAIWGGAVHRWDQAQQSWNAITSNDQDVSISAIEIASDGAIYASLTDGVARWNGAAWDLLGEHASIYLAPDDRLYRIESQEDEGQSVSRWSDGSWHILVDGVRKSRYGSGIATLAASGDTVFVGGSLVFPNGVMNGGLVDGTSIQPVVETGLMLHGEGSMHADPGGNVWVVGLLDQAGNVDVHTLAKWDGTSWSNADPPVSGTNAIAFDRDGTPYLTGQFGWNLTWRGLEFTDSTYSNILVLQEGSWEHFPPFMCEGPLGAPVAIYRLAFSPIDNAMTAGGTCYYTSVSDRNQVIGRWNGNGWEVIGRIPGPEHPSDAQLRSLAFAPNGDLYAGGDFDSVNDLPAEGIARWDGSLWHALGDGLYSPYFRFSGQGRLLEPWSGMMIVGGDFQTAGAIGAPNVAAYDGSNWISVDSPFYGGRMVSLVAASDGLLYATGLDGEGNGLFSRYDGQRWQRIAGGFLNPPEIAQDARGGFLLEIFGTGADDGVRRWLPPGIESASGEQPPRSTGTEIEVYPNPTDGEATALLNMPATDRVRATLVDVLGRELAVVFDGEVQEGDAATFTLDLAPYPSGLYFVQVTSSSGVSARAVVRR